MYELSPIGRQEYIDGEKSYCILRLDAILTDDRSNGGICEIGLQLRIHSDTSTEYPYMIQ